MNAHVFFQKELLLAWLYWHTWVHIWLLETRIFCFAKSAWGNLKKMWKTGKKHAWTRKEMNWLLLSAMKRKNTTKREWKFIRRHAFMTVICFTKFCICVTDIYDLNLFRSNATVHLDSCYTITFSPQNMYKQKIWLDSTVYKLLVGCKTILKLQIWRLLMRTLQRNFGIALSILHTCCKQAAHLINHRYRHRMLECRNNVLSDFFSNIEDSIRRQPYLKFYLKFWRFYCIFGVFFTFLIVFRLDWRGFDGFSIFLCGFCRFFWNLDGLLTFLALFRHFWPFFFTFDILSIISVDFRLFWRLLLSFRHFVGFLTVFYCLLRTISWAISFHSIGIWNQSSWFAHWGHHPCHRWS